MVKSADPAITAFGEATPTRMRCETLRPSFLYNPASSARKAEANVSVGAGSAIKISMSWARLGVGADPITNTRLAAYNRGCLNIVTSLATLV
jgi:hypothetical protein